MELSILIAKMLGIIYLAIGIGFLFKCLDYKKIYQDFMANAALLYITGFMITVLGFLLVNYHNIWEASWRVVITVIAWLVFTKGILILAMPNSLKHFSGMVEGKFVVIIPYFAIILGVIFTYLGFFQAM